MQKQLQGQASALAQESKDNLLKQRHEIGQTLLSKSAMELTAATKQIKQELADLSS